MSIVITVAETSDIVVTTTSTIGDAGLMPFTPHGSISSTTVQGALEELIDNAYNQAIAPDAVAHSVDEGDTWYDTTNNKLMVRRSNEWEELVLSNQLSDTKSDGDSGNYPDVGMDGGTY